MIVKRHSSKLINMDLIFANIIFALHLAFILFVLGGGFIVRYGRWLLYLHVLSVVYAILNQFIDWTCPLTYLKKYYLSLAGVPVYEETYIYHYILSYLFPKSVIPMAGIALGLLVMIVNYFAYFGKHGFFRDKKT